MKKYVLYPGVGRVMPGFPLKYIEGRQLAACYRVPYSECLDMDNPAIKKVVSAGKGPLYLISLIPMEDGVYKTPSSRENRLILSEGLHEAVNKNG